MRTIPEAVSQSIRETIADCELIKLIRNQSMEAGYIMNILYNLGKLSEMKEVSQHEYEDLGELFMRNVFLELNKFRTNASGESRVTENKAQIGADRNDFYQELTSEADSLLCMVFEQYMTPPSDIQERKEEETTDEMAWSCYQIFRRYESPQLDQFV